MLVFKHKFYKTIKCIFFLQEALNTLNKSNLTELKSFGSPPGVVTNVTAAVMVLLAQNGKIPKDRSWKAGKVRIFYFNMYILLNLYKV